MYDVEDLLVVNEELVKLYGLKEYLSNYILKSANYYYGKLHIENLTEQLLQMIEVVKEHLYNEVKQVIKETKKLQNKIKEEIVNENTHGGQNS